jgi:signal transduction histidine kinase
LVVWNIVTLAILMIGLGVVIHFLVSSFMLRSVDNELITRTDHVFGKPPMREGRQPGFGPGDNATQKGDGPGIRPDEPPQERRDRRNPFDAKGNELMPRLFDLKGKSILPDTKKSLWDQKGYDLALKGRIVINTLTYEDEPIRVISRPRRSEGKIDSVLQVPYPLREVQRAVAGLDRALLILIPFGLLFAGLGGLILTKRMLQPVRHLRQTAERLGAEDLSERLTISGQDEFADLATTFNGMLGRLEQAFQRQQRLVEQQRRFTADASHELRTPLTVVKANTSLTLTGKPTVADYNEAMEEIDRASDSMNRLVGHLLFLAQADDDRLGLDPIELPVKEILDDAMRLSQRPNCAPITFEAGESDLTVMGNQDELVRLFVNLLDNAQHYTPADGKITLSTRLSEGQVAISVADTGMGIAPEHIPHLGERFYRVDVSRSRQEGGSGLGLSICQSILAAHGGSLNIESTEGVGTTVTCRLPVVAN